MRIEYILCDTWLVVDSTEQDMSRIYLEATHPGYGRYTLFKKDSYVYMSITIRVEYIQRSLSRIAP